MSLTWDDVEVNEQALIKDTVEARWLGYLILTSVFDKVNSTESPFRLERSNYRSEIMMNSDRN